MIPEKTPLIGLIPSRVCPSSRRANGSARYQTGFWAACLAAMLASPTSPGWGADPPGLASIVDEVEIQPLKAQARRLVAALEFLGEPLTSESKSQLDEALGMSDAAAAAKAIQQALDARVLVAIDINAESRVHVERGPATATLTQNGWTVFLVKVQNDAGVTAGLRVSSPQAAPVFKESESKSEPAASITASDVTDRWIDVDMYDKPPLVPQLSGLRLEYRIVQIYSRDRGQREATLAFDVGAGTQDLGFRNEIPILFECRPGVSVILDVLDADGRPTIGQFIIRDRHQRVYPSRSRRLEPDFFFHDQIYRRHGEHVVLPPGEFEVSYSRGPEYVWQKKAITVPAGITHHESFHLKRWINLASKGWYSGDHHVHAAGCKHYDAPTQGVTPEAMMRHILGEDLNVGCVLTWGPCWYFQKQFFDGRVHKLSQDNYLMRYDVEVSGFPSAHAGHLCLLRLTEDDYPNTTRIEEWPSWDLPILKWGKAQGGVVGFSHSGWGLKVPGKELPNPNIPPFDGIGANEYIVDIVHNACDFISAVDTPPIWELSIWYHTLNCGYTCRISGETDFPCIYGDRVGLGRAYVKLAPGQPLDFDHWVQGIRDGRSYCCDGLSHLYDFHVNQLAVGDPGDQGRPSFLAVKSGNQLTIGVTAAALLEEKPREDIRQQEWDKKPYWHIERARIGDSRTVPVELIVNGQAVEQRELVADGTSHDLTFTYRPTRSSWIAIRILPAAHTNPVFVEVDGQPVRASKRSAEWCRQSVDVCWNAKQKKIRDAEREAAREAYDVARAAYQRIIEESFDDQERGNDAASQ